MRYIPNSNAGRREMLREMNVPTMDALLEGIPTAIRLKESLHLPPPLTEPELIQKFKSLEKKNAPSVLSFLGAGVNSHLIPSVIDSLISRSEFFTSYTPYQAEISQGTLQAIFEFQTFICQLTGMEVSNASMYDGSTALAEALLMAARITQKSHFLMSASVHPEYRQVASSLTRHQRLPIEMIGYRESGAVDLDDLKKKMSPQTAALVVQSPNFFGQIEPLRELAAIAHESGALLIVSVAEAISLGLLLSPGDAGADIVCGDAQSFGVPASFGGPHVGFLASRDRFVRNLPGRLTGQTVDADGKRGFVLTLSTREQHIRREKATSNICTNQSLLALVATIYCSLLGKHGIREVAAQNAAKTQYALEQLKAITTLKIPFSGPCFNEVVVELPIPYSAVASRFEQAGVVPGLELEPYFPELRNALLISFAETKSKAEIDYLLRLLAECK